MKIKLLFISLLFFSFLGFSQSDTTKPTLDYFTIVTDTLNTENSSDLFKYSIKVSDDISGVSQYQVWIKNPLGNNSFIVNQNVVNDTIEGSKTFEQYSPEGVYSIDRIYVKDKVGNDHYYTSNELSTLGFENSFYIKSQSDTTKPTLDYFTIVTDTLNTENSSDLFKYSIKVSDDISGVSQYQVWIKNPLGNNSFIVNQNVVNDTIEGSKTFEQYSPEGVYSIDRIYVKDKVGNDHYYTSNELSTLGFENSFYISYSYQTNHISIIPNNTPSSDISYTSVSLSSKYSSDGYLGGNIYIYYGKGDTLTDFHNTNIIIGSGVITQDVTVSTTLTNLDQNQIYIYKWVVKNNNGDIIYSSERSSFTTKLNNTPTEIVLSSSSVNENLAIGTEVGTLTSTDVDNGDTHTYTLVSGNGDTDNSSFTITNDKLKSGEVFDFETKSSYSIRVQTDDGNGGTFSKSFTISITDSQLSIDDEKLNKSLKFYPNPVSDILTIKSETITIDKVEIYSILGKKTKKINSNFSSISTNDLPKGIYIITVYSEKGVTTRKLIKR